MANSNTGRSNRLVIGLAAGVVFFVLVGGALLGAYFYLSRRSEPPPLWVDPLTAVDGHKVAPDLALLSLAGESDDRIFRAALDAGEKETAYAALAYSLLLPDSIRGGHWLLLAPYCQQIGGPRAGVCAQAALDLAALSPTLNDAARADLSLQAARDYFELKQPQAARMSLAQVENIARYSLSLLPAQRRDILGKLLEAYRTSGDSQAASAVQGLLGESISGSGVAAEPSRPGLADLRGSIVLPDSVASRLATRQQAAAQAAAKWFSSGQATRSQLAKTLGEALVQEDEARSQFYSSAAGLSPADHLALLHDQVAWLTTKYRVARGDFGVSLVPVWEGQLEQVQASLAEAYTQLINGYGQQIDALSAANASQARVDLLRQGVLWSRLGLLPGATEAALSTKLADASRQLWTRQGNAGLTVVVQEIGGKRFYLLSGSDASRS
jgi:hypothetical protein